MTLFTASQGILGIESQWGQYQFTIMSLQLTNDFPFNIFDSSVIH